MLSSFVAFVFFMLLCVCALNITSKMLCSTHPAPQLSRRVLSTSFTVVQHWHFAAHVLSRFKRKSSTTNRMSEDLDELFLSPIPAPTPVELQQCILFGFRRRLYPSQILDECRSAFGPFAPSAPYVARWYQRFQDGLFALDEHDADEEGFGGAGRGQTPTTCSDYNDDDDDDEEYDALPLVLHDVIRHSDKDSNNDDDEFHYDQGDDDDLHEDLSDEHVISYWHGYGYLGGKRRYVQGSLSHCL